MKEAMIFSVISWFMLTLTYFFVNQFSELRDR